MNTFGYIHLEFILILLENIARTKYSENIDTSNIINDYQFSCEVIDHSLWPAVSCNPNGNFNLSAEMQHIAQLFPNRTYYDAITVSGNAMLTELSEDAFNGISFGDIDLYVPTLTRIHSNAFASSANSTFRFLLNSPTLLQNSPPDYDLYYALSTLTNVTRIELSLDPAVEHSIPDNAFRIANGLQSRLNQITFAASFNISLIGNKAFYSIPRLTTTSRLRFYVNRVEKISSNAFDFAYSSDNVLYIELWSVGLTHQSFEDNVFSGFQRPVYLGFDGNRIEYIEENMFSQFFAAYQRNVMTLDRNDLNFKDTTRFVWLLEQKQQLESRVSYARCSDGRNLWDLEIPVNT